MKKMLAIALCLMMMLCCLPALAEDAAATPVTVSLVVADALGDMGFYDSANDGLEKLKADYGVNGKVVECKNDAGKWQPLLVEAAQSSDIVVCVGWEFWDALTEVVPQMPETKFVFVDNGLDGLGDNLVSIVYSENQGSFLVGYAAMKLSPNAKVGFVGGEDSDTINNFFIGYQAGALAANAEGTVSAPLYTDSYDDASRGKECADKLFSDGCDVIFQAADKAGLGVFESAKNNGKYAIGVDKDQKHVNPDVVICSMVKEVGLSIYDVVAQYVTDGTFAGGTIVEADLAGGYVGIAYGADDMTQQISDELKAEIEALKQQIVDCTIVVPSSYDAE